MNTAFGNSAMVWTPYLYPASEGPRYFKAWAVNLGLMVLCVIVTIFLRLALARDNKRLQQQWLVSGAGAAQEKNSEAKEGDQHYEDHEVGRSGAAEEYTPRYQI